MKIGLTQRVFDHFHGQPHDCLDATWAEFLFRLGFTAVPLPNLALSEEKIEHYLDEAGLDGLILTGGNDIANAARTARGSSAAPQRDKFEKTAIAWARTNKVPIFAVCRGLQMINMVLGGSMSTTEGHVGKDHFLNRTSASAPDWLKTMPAHFEVNSFHSFAIGVNQMAPGLVAAAIDKENHVEAAFHESERIGAIMWHPERLNPAHELDSAMISGFFGK